MGFVEFLEKQLNGASPTLVFLICGLFLILDFVFSLTIFVMLLKERAQKRRDRRMKDSREAVFTLPDRENTFVRDRLNTSLRAETDDSAAENTGEYGLEESKLRLNHVRELLTKLKAADLSPSDRLEAEGISRMITLYATKNLLSGKEVRELNDCLSVILKMTAKYAL